MLFDFFTADYEIFSDFRIKAKFKILTTLSCEETDCQ